MKPSAESSPFIPPLLVVTRCPECHHPITAASEAACQQAIDDHIAFEDESLAASQHVGRSTRIMTIA